MEPESDMPEMQPETWKRYIRGKWKPRIGQAKLFVIVATQTIRYAIANVIKCVFPTGYGKTLACLGAYVVARAQGSVNRLLVFVPNDDLRRQWSEDAGGDVGKLGATITGSLQLDSMTAAIRAHLNNKVEIVVATYQQLRSNNGEWLNELLATGDWMVCFDEFHHLREDGAWGKNANRIIKGAMARIVLMLSATPIRTDKAHTIDGGFEKDGDSWVFKPDVLVTKEQALKEEAIRKLKGQIHHYFVDVTTDGAEKPVRVTTEMLRDAGVTSTLEFSVYETRRELRYVARYLSTMVVDAVSIYTSRNMQHPSQHQILVFAMSCRHAQVVAEQFNLMGGVGFADWIGVGPFGRPDKENAAILKKYKDGHLPCLVQVDKAGEGFNNPRSSILVFIHLIKSGPKLIQQIGRGERRNYSLPFKDDYCVVLVSADTDLAEYIKTLEIELTMDESSEGDGGGDRWPLFSDLMSVDAEYDRLETINQQARDAEMESILKLAEEHGAPPEIRDMDLEWLRRFVRRVSGGEKNSGAAPRFADETAKKAHYSKKVEQILSTFVSKAVGLYGKQAGNGFDASLLGPAKRTVHARWNRVKRLNHDEMDSDEFKAKYYWIRDEYEKMRTLREIPSWLSLSSSNPPF